jgi:hypothetical protein
MPNGSGAQASPGVSLTAEIAKQRDVKRVNVAGIDPTLKEA